MWGDECKVANEGKGNPLRTLAPVLALAIAACGSTPPPPKKVIVCDAGLCGTVCCATGTICENDSAGNPYCATLCEAPTDCTAADAGCCQPLLVGGNYMGQSICTPRPYTVTPYSCTCTSGADCLNRQECAPLIGDSSGFISGPYVCLPNDGQNHHGCALPPSTCSVQGQYCATDNGGNEFCSQGCDPDAGDTECKNPGIACCNATCHDNMRCCGLCGH